MQEESIDESGGAGSLCDSTGGEDKCRHGSETRKDFKDGLVSCC